MRTSSFVVLGVSFVNLLNASIAKPHINKAVNGNSFRVVETREPARLAVLQLIFDGENNPFGNNRLTAATCQDGSGCYGKSNLSLIHISEPTRLLSISYAV